MNKSVIFLVAAMGIIATAYAVRVPDKNPVCPTATTTAGSGTYVCKRCDGSGYEPSMTKACPYCNRGRVQHYRNCEVCRGEGYSTDRYGDKQKCTNCDGTGKKYVDETCAYCDGTGSVRMKCMTCHGSGTVEK